MNLFALYISLALETGAFEQGINKAKDDAAAFGGELDKSTEKTTKLSASFGDVFKAVGGWTLLNNAIGAVTSSIGGAIERYDTLNRFPRVLESLGYDGQLASAAMDKLAAGIQGLPTSLDGIVQSTQRLATMTGDLELATDTSLALNNAFLASGASADDARRGMEQYVQSMAMGKPQMQEWRTLQQTMGTALADLAEAFGFAGQSAQMDLYEALKEGLITFDQVNRKLIELNTATGGFAETARTASEGIGTSWGNIALAIQRGVANMITAMNQGGGHTRQHRRGKAFGRDGKRAAKGGL